MLDGASPFHAYPSMHTAVLPSSLLPMRSYTSWTSTINHYAFHHSSLHLLISQAVAIVSTSPSSFDRPYFHDPTLPTSHRTFGSRFRPAGPQAPHDFTPICASSLPSFSFFPVLLPFPSLPSTPITYSALIAMTYPVVLARVLDPAHQHQPEEHPQANTQER